MPPSEGEKVTLCADVPIFGVEVGVVQANVPPTLAEPPLKVELAKVCPRVMAVAVGAEVIVGVALLTVTFTVVVAVL